MGRSSSHFEAMISNMLVSLFRYERIETTTPKAKELRSVADQMVTLGKRGDLHARRQVKLTIGQALLLLHVIRTSSVLCTLQGMRRDVIQFAALKP